MKTKMKTNKAFSLLELMVVITIIAILASVAGPTYTKAVEKARILKDVAHQDQIIKACKLYAQDWDGLYPTFDTSSDDADGEEFGNSTDAFNELIKEVGLSTELIFYLKSKSRKRPPNEDGVLEVEENGYSYVVGQTDSSMAGSPLTADALEAGTYGTDHPWLRSGKAVVGFCGGQVRQMRLSQKSAGASVRGPLGSGMDDIFQEGEQDEEGKITGGLMEPETTLVDPE